MTNDRHRSSSPPEPTPWRWLILLTLVGALVRIIGIGQQLWYDEITTLVQSVRQPLIDIVTRYESQNVHMLYSVQARISISIFGEHIWSLRLPAFLFGVATIPLLYFYARAVTTPRESLFASALLALSYHHVWFTDNARGYTMMVFWTLASTLLFLRAGRDGRVKLWPAYALVMALGLYTHLTMAFVLAAHVLVFAWALTKPARRDADLKRQGWLPLRAFVMTGVITLLLYAPILPKLFSKTVGQTDAQVQSDWTNPLWLLLEILHGVSGGRNLWLVGAALLLAGAITIAGVVSYWKESRNVALLMILPGAITAVVMLAVSHNLWPRFFFFSIGFAFLFLLRGVSVFADWLGHGQAWAKGRAPLMATVASIAIIAASAVTVPPAFMYPKQDFIWAMRFVESQQKTGEHVFTAGLAVFPYQKYFGKDWPELVSAAQLESVRPAGTNVWVVYTLPIFIESRHPEIWKLLQTDFDNVRVFRGTLGGGEVVVCKSKWHPGAPGS